MQGITLGSIDEVAYRLAFEIVCKVETALVLAEEVFSKNGRT